MQNKNNTQVVPFNFGSHQVRVVTLEGEPWFVAADVCAAFGYQNPTEMVRHLDASERAKNFLGSAGPARNVISEAGLYTVVLRAQRTHPEARTFQDWVTREVLPSIRKTGAFVTGQPSLVENPTMDPLDLLMAQAQGTAKAPAARPIELPEASPCLPLPG